MADDTIKHDENDQSNTRREALQRLNAATDKHLTTWQAMYDDLKRVAGAYTTNPCKEQADFAIATLLSFILAMESLPEEGDIVTIARKMNEIMVMRPDLTGITVSVGNGASNTASSGALAGLIGLLASAAMASMAIPDTPADGDPSDPKKPTGKVLH